MSHETIIPIAYRAGEVAKLFGVSERAVRTWVHTGVIPGRVIGGTVFAWRDAVDRIVAEAKAA